MALSQAKEAISHCSLIIASLIVIAAGCSKQNPGKQTDADGKTEGQKGVQQKNVGFLSDCTARSQQACKDACVWVSDQGCVPNWDPVCSGKTAQDCEQKQKKDSCALDKGFNPPKCYKRQATSSCVPDLDKMDLVEYKHECEKRIESSSGSDQKNRCTEDKGDGVGCFYVDVSEGCTPASSFAGKIDLAGFCATGSPPRLAANKDFTGDQDPCVVGFNHDAYCKDLGHATHPSKDAFNLTKQQKCERGSVILNTTNYIGISACTYVRSRCELKKIKPCEEFEEESACEKARYCKWEKSSGSDSGN